MNNTFHYTSPLGGITLSSDSETLTGLWFDGQKYFPHKLVEESSEADLQLARYLFQRKRAGLHSTYKSAHNAVPKGSVRHTSYDTLRTDYDLRRDSQYPRRAARS